MPLFGRSHPLLPSRLGFSPSPSVSLRGEYPGEYISGHPRDLVESAVPGCGKVVGTSSVPLARESHSWRDASPLPPPMSVFSRSHPLLLCRWLFPFSASSVSSRGEYPGENISGHPHDQVESAVAGCGKVVGTSSVPLVRESYSRRGASLTSINRRYLLLPLFTATFMNKAVLTGSLQIIVLSSHFDRAPLSHQWLAVFESPSGPMIPPLLLPRTTGRAMHHCTANKSFDSLHDFVRSCLAAQWGTAVRFGSVRNITSPSTAWVSLEWKAQQKIL